jgi:predicted Zn-dependent peptidase
MLDGRGRAGAPALDIDCPPPTASRVLAVAMPGQEQVTLRLRTTAPSRADDDNIAAWAGSYIFGGHFLSRLNANLREEKGWTYGARASFSRTAYQGNLTVSVDVKSENVAGAVREIEGELQRLIDDGVTEAELALAQRSLVATWNESLVTADDAHGRYLSAVEDGEAIADRRARYLALADVRTDDVQRVAAEHWGNDGVRVWVLVGEQEAVQAQLDALGWTAEWVDPAAAILGKVPPATP